MKPSCTIFGEKKIQSSDHHISFLINAISVLWVQDEFQDDTSVSRNMFNLFS